MAQENLTGLREAMEAFRRGEPTDADLLAPDFELHQASSIIDTAGVFRGPESLEAVGLAADA